MLLIDCISSDIRAGTLLLARNRCMFLKQETPTLKMTLKKNSKMSPEKKSYIAESETGKASFEKHHNNKAIGVDYLTLKKIIFFTVFNFKT